MTEAHTQASRSAGGSQGQVPAWMVLALVCLAQFMVLLDVSIVNVALPDIRRALGFSPTGLQWVVNAYTLTFAGFLLLGGRAADLFGRRRIFLLGLVIFSAASLAGGFAQSQGMLIAARAVQGLGGAILSPATLTVLTTTFPEGRPRQRAMGTWAAVAGAGGAAGALFGGILTDFLSWRWILFINVPIGLFALVAARAILVESRADTEERSLDVAGALTVTGGLVALVFGIVRTDTYSWTSWQTVASFAVALALLGAFLVIETRIATAPLMPLGLLRSRSVSGANLVMFCMGGAMFAMWFFLSLYMQNVLGYTPLQAGLAFLPQTFALIVGAQIASRVVGRVGARRMLIFGTLMSAAGLAWLSQVSSTGSFVSDLLGPGVLITLGLGLSFTPVTLAATAGVRREEAGLASGLVNTSRQVGGSIGLAALATIASDRTKSLLTATHPTHQAVGEALTSGYARAFEVGALIALVGTVAALALPPLRTPPAEQATAPPAPAADLHGTDGARRPAVSASEP